MLGGTSRPPHVRDKDGSARRRGSDLSGSEDQTGRELWHVYDLVRGVTRARVESIEWSRDMRWVAVGTAKGTLRKRYIRRYLVCRYTDCCLLDLFAINPYGGRPDEDSHLEGRVRNVLELVSLFHEAYKHDD